MRIFQPMKPIAASVPIRPSGPARPPLRGAVGAVVLVALLGGCDDTPTGPAAGLVAVETGYAALALDPALPGPEHPDVVGGMDEATAEALNAWHRSWQVAPVQGHEQRAGLYPVLAAGFGEQVDADELAHQVERLGRGVERARALDPSVLPPRVAAGIATGGTHWERARVAVARGDLVRAAENLLRGADALREVGAEAVARSLLADAEAALRRVPTDGSYSRSDLERARRLLQGSRYAVEQRAWELAIRRAYYGKGLLDGGR